MDSAAAMQSLTVLLGWFVLCNAMLCWDSCVLGAAEAKGAITRVQLRVVIAGCSLQTMPCHLDVVALRG